MLISYYGKVERSYLIFVMLTKKEEVHIVAFQWLNICRTKVNIFRERLTLDDVVAEDEAT